MRRYFRALYGDHVGRAHIAVGSDPHRTDTGKYGFGHWSEHTFAWPTEADQLEREISRAAHDSDVYVCPYLMHADKRTPAAAVARPVLHADVDGGRLGRDKARQLGAFVVGSGSPGNGHVYLLLAESVPAHWHRALARGLVAYLDADPAKISANDLLRPPGTFNHKPTVDGGDPAPVEFLIEPDGTTWDVHTLAALLGVTLPAVDETAAASAASSAPTDAETFDLAKYPRVKKALDQVTSPPDRSADTARVVGACYDNGLTLPHARYAVNSRADLAARLAERTDDDVLTCWHKIDTDRRRKRLDDAELFAPYERDNAAAPTVYGIDDDTPQKGIQLVKVSNVTTEKPEWAWEFDGKGRILKAAITLFGGRPGAGKSTCARWYAAGWSQGTLPGCFEGQPVNVAYIATEESWNYTVAPSLKAAGADMDRVYFVQDGDDPARIRSITDEATLTELFVANNIRAVFLDPLMGTINGDADINRNNEVRDYLDPWVRIAEKIDGPVIGICHMTKAPTGDVVASITGSSAFGELARCVFGFAIDRESDDGTRVMSQAKNSAGFEDLSLAYRIGSHRVTLDDGQTTDMARFELIGPTDKTVRELLIAERSTHTRSGTDECAKWLKGFLTARGRSLREDVMSAATEFGFSPKMARTAARKLCVHMERTREVPSRSYWSLPKAAE